ncbi:MAG: hypothetical protein ACXAC7_19535, partial [Candidatus Hodarchaeales archaeon]
MKIRAFVPDFLKESKYKEVRLSSLDFQKLSQVQPVKEIDYDQFTNQDVLKELEATYKQALKHLQKENHESVWDIFQLLFEKDLELKQEVAKALMPQNDTEILPEEELHSIIELHGFYSNFRIRLIEEISSLLVYIYDQATEMVTTNLDEGGRLANHAQGVY